MPEIWWCISEAGISIKFSEASQKGLCPSARKKLREWCSHLEALLHFRPAEGVHMSNGGGQRLNMHGRQINTTEHLSSATLGWGPAFADSAKSVGLRKRARVPTAAQSLQHAA